MRASVSVAPWSPARACANSCSLRFTVLFQQRAPGLHARALEKQRDDADALLRMAAHAAAARRAVDPERLHLGADTLGERARRRAGRDTQTHLVRRVRVAEIAAVRAIDADHVDAHLGHILAQALAHDLAREPGALHRLRTGVRDLAFADEAGAIADAHLEGSGALATAGASYGDAVAFHLGERDGSEVGDDIRRDVAAGVGHLIEELLLHRAQRDRPAGAGDLAQHTVAVGIGIAPRETELREIWDVLEPGLSEVTTGDLACAFQQVADRGRPPEQAPIVQAPAELAHQRR